MSSLKPVRKRGRPTTREKALERDKGLLLDKFDSRPGDFRKTPIRHPIHLNGMIYNFRMKPDRTLVWNVRFPDAPGGEQKYEMDKSAIAEAMTRYKEWSRRCSFIPQDEDGKDSC
jgi:hypothetical protein